jgi:ketosteroid isomerase-like protein
MPKTRPLSDILMERDILAIQEVLQKFQDAYTRRDVRAVDSFLEDLFLLDNDLLIIGTGANEWCQGMEEARKLFVGDWEYWGDVCLDLPAASVVVEGTAGWVTAQGTVTKTIDEDTFLDAMFEQLREQQEQQDTARARAFNMLRSSADALFEAGKGDLFVWPFRLSAVLVKQGEKWLFTHLHFSFPTTRCPDVRLDTPAK